MGDGGYSALGRDFDPGSRLTRRHTAQYTSWGMFSYLGVPSMYGVPSMFSVVTVFEIWLPRAGWCLQSDAVILCPMHVFRYGKFQISFGPAFLAFSASGNATVALPYRCGLCYAARRLVLIGALPMALCPKLQIQAEASAQSELPAAHARVGAGGRGLHGVVEYSWLGLDLNILGSGSICTFLARV